MARWARPPQDAALVLVATARELGHDPERLTARQALDSWVAAAQVPFRVPRVEGADGLSYGFGVRDGAFQVDLVRRFASRESEGHTQATCRVRVPVTPEVEALGSHGEWCFEPPASPGRLAWTVALAARPEWAVLDRAAGVEVVISGDGA